MISRRISTPALAVCFSRRAYRLASSNLPQSSSVHHKVNFFFSSKITPRWTFPKHHRILDALSPEPDNLDDHDDADCTEMASVIITSSGRPPSAISGTRVPNYESYRSRLEPLVELEDRLARLLSSPDEDEPTHLPSPSSYPAWDPHSPFDMQLRGIPPTTPNGNAAVNVNRRPAPTIYIPQKSQSRGSPVSPLNGNSSASGHSASSSPSSSKSSGRELTVRASNNWKKAFTLGGKSKSPKSTHSGEIEGWWEDPEDPVHTLNACAPVMLELWRDTKVRQRLREKRLRLEESSGL